ncbi:MAG: hypothetical protein K9K30_14985 [Burkholderiaceae bacterium]|nr:hypothetical protein [Sulfuritalea sp.]MCF8176541.1 hypothetical protein [Burkholderiaceae bacterium]
MRKIYSSTVIAIILVLTLGQPHAGFLILALVLPFAVWLTYSAYVIVKRPYARLTQFICIFVWVVAIEFIGGAHYIWHATARRDANEVVIAITTFMKVAGNCPRTLDWVGLKADKLEAKLGANYRYSCSGGKPHFSYVATFTVFDTYSYDFEQGVWKYEKWSEKTKFLDTAPPGLRKQPGEKLQG